MNTDLDHRVEDSVRVGYGDLGLAGVCRLYNVVLGEGRGQDAPDAISVQLEGPPYLLYNLSRFRDDGSSRVAHYPSHFHAVPTCSEQSMRKSVNHSYSG